MKTNLHQVLHLIFEVTDKEGLSDKDIAQISKLSRPTIWRLRNGKYRYPYYQTVEKLALAIGFAILCIRKERKVA